MRFLATKLFLNQCGNYNKFWVCPPASWNTEKMQLMMNDYKYCFVFTTKHDLEDSFDLDGMTEGRKVHKKVEEILYDFVDEIGAKIYGPGACTICEKCAYPNEKCRFPKKAKPGLESIGISVVSLAHEANINYINGANTVTYFSAVFFK